MPTIKEDAKSAVKISRKTFFNPRGWFGYDNIKSQVQNTLDLTNTLFVEPELKHPETFRNAIARLRLTDEELHQKEKRFLIYSAVFVALAVVTIITGIWLLIHHGTIAGFVLAIPTAALFLANAFRFHFWAFQIKHRKLGCTFNEWLSGKINGNSP